MAKRLTKIEMQGIFWLIVITVPLYFVFKLGEWAGWVLLVIITFSIVGFVIWGRSVSKKKRRSELVNKYQDEELVDNLMRKMFWQEQTADQLRDSLGKPHDIDRKILKTKKKEI
ncbi:MAG: hypothetical protein V7722_08110 [Porticoccus sp.]